MLIYRVSGIFAHKKTIKQFLQPIIEQVWGVDVPGGCAAFLRQFSELLYFCVGFFNSLMPLWVDFTNICIFFHQKVKPCFEHKIFVMYN